MIPKLNYYDPAIFDREMDQLFRGRFVFAGLTDELAGDRDFVCVDHAGSAIVVQNYKGELRAFQNVCSHRFNRIQLTDRGNGPLTCRYHGWTFDRRGFPAGLPKREQFLDGTERDERLCLPAYEVATCGRFVFVRERGGPGDLRGQLGDFFDVLEEIGAHIGAEIHFTHVDHAANWKLLVENVVECYHCATAHRDTFVPLGVGRLPISDVMISGANSSSHFPRVDQEREELRRRYLSHLSGRGLAHNSFHHIFIFPNLFITSSEGLSFYVGQLMPTGPETTRLRMRLFEPALELSPKHRARQVPINDGTVATSLQLIEEDRAILEAIQIGLRLSPRPGALGGEEVRIRAFADQYFSLMADAIDVDRGAATRARAAGTPAAFESERVPA